MQEPVPTIDGDGSAPTIIVLSKRQADTDFRQFLIAAFRARGIACYRINVRTRSVVQGPLDDTEVELRPPQLLQFLRKVTAADDCLILDSLNYGLPAFSILMRLASRRAVWAYDVHDDFLYDVPRSHRAYAKVAMGIHARLNTFAVHAAPELGNAHAISHSLGNASHIKPRRADPSRFDSVLIIASIDERFDFDLVAAIVASCDVTFDVYGAISGGLVPARRLAMQERLDMLCAGPRVRYRGSYNNAAIEQILEGYSVMFAPYDTTSRSVRFIDPLRFYHCLNFGMAVISTRIPAVAAFPDVHVIDAAADFARVINGLRAGGGAPIAKAAREDRTWEGKAQRLLDVFENHRTQAMHGGVEPSRRDDEVPAKVVLVFRKDLLPLSETFIVDQIASYASWSGVLLGFRRVQGIDVDALKPLLATSLGGPIGATYLKVLQHGQYFGLRSRRLAAIIRRIGARLVHAHFGYDAILISDVVAGLGLPLCVTLHGTDILTREEVWASGEKGRFFKRYPGKLAALLKAENTHIICVSEALRAAALAKGAPPARTHVFYTGIDPSRFAPALERRPASEILFVGRLVAFKGVEFLVRAMSIIVQQHPDARLTVIGDGPQRVMLEQLAASLEIDVLFLGALPAARVAEAMSTASIFCLPSVTDDEGNFEAFGMVMLEAQACGLPVVTSARAGREAILDGVTGFLFPERDVEALADLIVRLIADEDLFVRMGRAAQSHVAQTFDVRTCTAKIEAFYDALVT